MCHYFEYDTNLSFTQVVEYCEVSKSIKGMNNGKLILKYNP